MRSPCAVAVALLAVLAPLAAPGRAAAPPAGDPCAHAGRDTCGTTGVGFYRTYRYGTRWFGDYRGAVPGEAVTFCVDLGRWYASPRFRYRRVAAGPLRDAAGAVVPAVDVARIAYALWADGRTASRDEQAAVMLFVHARMGDARPGEIDPPALGPRVAARYAALARAADRWRGPYRIETRLSPLPTIGSPAHATVRVLSAAGDALPSVRLELATTGATAPAGATTDASGVARVPLTPTSAAGLRLTVTTEPLAAAAPAVFAPTTDAAAGRAQRLAAPRAQRVTAALQSPVRARVQLSTAATATRVALGETVADRVTIAGARPGWRGSVAVRVHGPFRSRAAIRCDGTPAWTASLAAAGSGVFTTPSATLQRPGWYSFQEAVAPAPGQFGTTTPCAAPGETFEVDAQPAVSTSVSAQVVRPGAPIQDRVFVSGLAGERGTVDATLYGPFATREAIDCGAAPVWSGTIPVAGDGEYRTQPFIPGAPGYYAYRERIRAGGFVRAAEATCGEAAETAVVHAQPQLTTRAQSQPATGGTVVSDTVEVAGLGSLSVPVRVELWGPFAARAAIRCNGVPYWTGSLTAAGDGTYASPPVRLDRAGYYTFREEIAASEVSAPASSPCAATAETTLERARPMLSTVVAGQVVRPGARVSDLVRPSGAEGADVDVRVDVFGPFATRAAIRCTGAPAWRGRLALHGDTAARTPAAPLARAGFYAFRERVLPSPLVVASTTACALAAETPLAAPRIVTGRNDVADYVPAPAAGGATPTRIRIPALHVDAPVAPVGIDVRNGVLGVPDDIRRTAWWRDGAAPGAASGTVLVAGHVDSATRGAGAFFGLRRLRRGDAVSLATRAGRVHRYRVVSVRLYAKAALPSAVYARGGPPRLVLVTCGGPFDATSRHYVDNVVVTAAPA